MPKVNHQTVLRLMDANFNRAKEGLRVCEDICRFILNIKSCSQQLKQIRHELSAVIGQLSLKKMVAFRDVHRDVGKNIDELKSTRKSTQDVFYANAQRVKESLRVLEEFSKLFDAPLALKIKRLRYTIYGIEQKILKQL